MFQTVLLREVIQLQTGKLKIVTMPFHDFFFFKLARNVTFRIMPTQKE